MFATPAPVLEHLLLHAESYGAFALPIPIKPFNGCAPRLVELSVARLRSFEWQLAGWAGLRCIEICSSEGPSFSRQYSLDEALAALSTASALKDATFEHCLAFAPGRPTRPAVTLPRLDTLRLAGDVADCTSLMARLDLPSFDTLHCDLTARSGEDYLAFFPALSIHLGSDPLTSVVFNTHNYRVAFELYAYRFCHTVLDTTDAEPVRTLNLSLAAASDPGKLRRFTSQGRSVPPSPAFRHYFL